MIKLILILFVSALASCSTSEPTKPLGVPAEAFFVGGTDGGVFLNCSRNSGAIPSYRCRIYRDTNGELLSEDDFAITDGNPEFNPEDKGMYRGWDGRILLVDYRTLEKVKVQPAEYEQVNYKGVNFKYNKSVFGGVVATEVAEFPLVPNEKPDSVAPKHLAFTFELRKQYNEANLMIYPVSEYIRIMAADKDSQRGTELAFKDLRSVLRNKDLRFEGYIPFIPFREGSQEFQAKVKLSDFENGKGIFFITHWGFEVALISNELLYYVFEGLTNDGKFYVVAEMPTNAPFLPDTSPDEFDGFSIRDYYDDYRNNGTGIRHKEYRSKIASRLDSLSSDDYHPNLVHLEELIASLKIER